MPLQSRVNIKVEGRLPGMSRKAPLKGAMPFMQCAIGLSCSAWNGGKVPLSNQFPVDVA